MSPIDRISTYINKYLWPADPEPVKKPEEAVKPAVKTEPAKEPTWGNPYTKGNSLE